MVIGEGTMRTLLYSLVLAAFAAGITVADTNVTGKWTGVLTRLARTAKPGNRLPSLLKQSGSEITGTVGPNENDQNMVVRGRRQIMLVAEDEERAVNFHLLLGSSRPNHG